MKLIAPFLFSVLIIGCTNSENEPCEWQENKFYATVESVNFKEINPSGDSTFTVLISFTAGSLAGDLHDLGKLREIEFTKEKIKANSAYKGSTYTGIINDVIDGNCETPIISFDQKRR